MYHLHAIILQDSELKYLCQKVTGLSWRIQSFEALVLLFLIPYVLIRHLKYIAAFSSVANLLTIFGLAVILVYCFCHLQPVSSFPAFGSFKGLAIFFGQAIFTFEGIAVVSCFYVSNITYVDLHLHSNLDLCKGFIMINSCC